MKTFKDIGKVALGSRLRLLTDIITFDAARIYKLYDIDINPKWFPVYYALSNDEAKTITAIAREISHSHPSVSKIVAEMKEAGLIEEKADTTDGRRTVVTLAPKGHEITTKIANQYIDVENAIDEMIEQSQHNLWKAVKEWELLLQTNSILQRVTNQKKLREMNDLKIVDYNPEYKDAFKNLNKEWIKKYFKMEKADYAPLDDPEGYILDKGGHILVALYGQEPVAVCALIKMKDDNYDYELAKMAVSPRVHGRGIGYQLGLAAIEKAKLLGAASLYLESNTVLEPAIKLYRKLGFTEVSGRQTPYERCNIQMQLVIT